jgi:hypothetical protein
MPDGNLRKLFRVLSLGKDHLGHPAPDSTPKIEAGKVADLIKAETFNLPGGIIESDLAVFIPFEES